MVCFAVHYGWFDGAHFAFVQTRAFGCSRTLLSNCVWSLVQRVRQSGVADSEQWRPAEKQIKSPQTQHSCFFYVMSALRVWFWQILSTLSSWQGMYEPEDVQIFSSSDWLVTALCSCLTLSSQLSKQLQHHWPSESHDLIISGLTICRAERVKRGGAGGGGAGGRKEEPDQYCGCNLTPSTSSVLPERSLLTALFCRRGICLRGLVPQGRGPPPEVGVQAVRSLPVFFSTVCVCVREGFWTISARVFLSLSTEHPVCWLHRRSESPASVLLWLAHRYRGERETDRQRQCSLSFLAYTLWSQTGETGERKECFHSTYSPLSHRDYFQHCTNRTSPVFQEPLQPGTVDLPLWTEPRSPNPWGAGGNVLTGAGPEDPCLPGADRLAPLQV